MLCSGLLFVLSMIDDDPYFVSTSFWIMELALGTKGQRG